MWELFWDDACSSWYRILVLGETDTDTLFEPGIGTMSTSIGMGESLIQAQTLPSLTLYLVQSSQTVFPHYSFERNCHGGEATCQAQGSKTGSRY